MSSVAEVLERRHEPLVVVRASCAGVAAVVVIDALAVGAPGLALMAVPFVIAAFRFSHGTSWGAALVVAACALYVLVGVNLIVANGLNMESWADLLFAYVGTPLAAIAGLVTVRKVLMHATT